MTFGLPPIWSRLPRTRERGVIKRRLFETDIVPANVPCIMRGQTARWPVVAHGLSGAESLCSYLIAHASPKPAELWVGKPHQHGRFNYTPDFKDVNFERKLACIADICALLLRCRAEADPPALFAGAVYAPDCLPDLIAKLPMPLLSAAQERLTSLWIGNRSRTAAHWDRPGNLACPIAGPRYFLMFPPVAIADLYIGPIDFTLAGQPMSLVDCENPDFINHPRFAQALDIAQLAVVEPGDALYIPPLWFHYVLSPSDLGAQINFWWIDGDSQRPGPLNALLFGLLTLRDLPAHERRAWRSFFDHYIFEASAETISYLPPDARGVLGKLTKDDQRALQHFLTAQLKP